MSQLDLRHLHFNTESNIPWKLCCIGLNSSMTTSQRIEVNTNFYGCRLDSLNFHSIRDIVRSSKVVRWFFFLHFQVSSPLVWEEYKSKSLWSDEYLIHSLDDTRSEDSTECENRKPIRPHPKWSRRTQKTMNKNDTDKKVNFEHGVIHLQLVL